MWAHQDTIIVHLTIDGEMIETTPEHPFYVGEGEWVAAGELVVGDEINRANGETGAVDTIRFMIDPQPMYNFTVDVAHTYFVGDGEWLVHNTCPYLSKVSWTENIPDVTVLGRDYVRWGTGSSGAGMRLDEINEAVMAGDLTIINELHVAGVTSDMAYQVADWYEYLYKHPERRGGDTAEQRAILMNRIGDLLGNPNRR